MAEEIEKPLVWMRDDCPEGRICFRLPTPHGQGEFRANPAQTKLAGELLRGYGDKCTWKLIEDGRTEESDWSTACGQEHLFFNGSPAENSYKFCPYCGKPLEEG